VTVQLEPPLTRSSPWPHTGHPPDEALPAAPRYMRHETMSRWHRPRSGVRRGRTGLAAITHQPQRGELVCGTCEGRAIGAGQDAWPVRDGPSLVFEPRRLTPPARCPGSRRERLAERAGLNVLRCLACGELAPGRVSGGPWNSMYGPVNHPPGPGLVPGCLFHAWDQLIVHDGKAICACQMPTKGDSA
jgi:hypothetical protein